MSSADDKRTKMCSERHSARADFGADWNLILQYEQYSVSGSGAHNACPSGCIM